MIVFPNAKINLGLHVLERRTDGFHDLETLFYPIPLCDALEIVRGDAANDVFFTCSGIDIDTPAEDNICVRAYSLLKKDYPALPPVLMHLHKVIPMGAGLGGGSADGAFALSMLNKKFGLEITREKLAAYALELGSDCPFFLHNQPCLASGRGEQLREFPVDLSAYMMVLVYPGIHVSTRDAFSMMLPTRNRTPVSDIVQMPVENWKQVLVNDFELPVFEKFPAIREVKETFYNHGAVYASMSGSGSSVFGLFPRNTPPTLSFPSGYLVKHLLL